MLSIKFIDPLKLTILNNVPADKTTLTDANYGHFFGFSIVCIIFKVLTGPFGLLNNRSFSFGRIALNMRPIKIIFEHVNQHGKWLIGALTIHASKDDHRWLLSIILYFRGNVVSFRGGIQMMAYSQLRA